MSVDEYTDALRRELRDQSREVRRAEVESLREHLGELPEDARTELSTPAEYARTYRAQRDLRQHRLLYWWRGVRMWMRIAGAVVLVLAIGATWAGIWLAHYDPVGIQFFSSGPAGATVPKCDEQRYSVTADCTVKTGYVFFVGGTISNHSPFTVDLTAVPQAEDGLFDIVRLLGPTCPPQVLGGQPSCASRPLPWHIAPHSTVEFGAVVRIAAGCVPGTTMGAAPIGSFERISLRFHFAGGTRLMTVDAGSDFFHFPGPCSGVSAARLSHQFG